MITPICVHWLYICLTVTCAFLLNQMCMYTCELQQKNKATSDPWTCQQVTVALRSGFDAW